MKTSVYSSLKQLPATYDALFDAGAKQSFYLGLPWFQNLLQTTADPGEELRLYGVEEDSDTAQALLIARCGGPDRRRSERLRLRGYANMYSPLFGAINRPDNADVAALADHLANAICRDRKWSSIRFDAWRRDCPFFGGLARAFRDRGLWVQEFFHFRNWYEPVEGSIDAYLERRPSILRHTLERKSRKLRDRPDYRFDIVTNGPGLNAAAADYQAAYAASWKRSEPYPRFAEGLIRTAAAAGCLRLGLLHIQEQPVAAQIWLVSNGHATIFKLAHDRRFKDLSPGSLLTLHVMRHVIEADRVREVDFGRGDDRFKRLWLSQRRERWGLLAFNPRTLDGLQGTVRNFGGRAARKLLRRRSG